MWDTSFSRKDDTGSLEKDLRFMEKLSTTLGALVSYVDLYLVNRKCERRRFGPLELASLVKVGSFKISSLTFSSSSTTLNT